MTASSEPTLELDLPATPDGLRDGLEALERRGAELDLTPAAIARILLVFEEIFTNTVKYGYRDRAGGRVRVGLAGRDPLQLVLEDDAAPFDPTAWDPRPDMAGDVTDRPVGRLGLALVMGMARRARWEALRPGNRLLLELSGDPSSDE